MSDNQLNIAYFRRRKAFVWKRKGPSDWCLRSLTTIHAQVHLFHFLRLALLYANWKIGTIELAGANQYTRSIRLLLLVPIQKSRYRAAFSVFVRCRQNTRGLLVGVSEFHTITARLRRMQPTVRNLWRIF